MRWLALLLAICLPAAAATYYVDSATGLDSNAGTSSGAPWKNCPGMFHAYSPGQIGTNLHTGSGSLAAGDTVYFNSASTWTVSNGSNVGGGGIILTGGVWYVGNAWPSVPTTYHGPSLPGAKIVVDGFCAAGAVRINQDHATQETIFEGFEIDGQTNAANGIDINHGFWTTGLIKATKRIKSCWVHDFRGAGATSSGGTNGFFYGVIISDNSTDESGRVANVEILDTMLERPSRDGFCMYPGDNGSISNILFRNCVDTGIKNDAAYSEGHGFLMKGRVKNSTIEYCMSTNVNSSPFFVNLPEGGGTLPGPTNCTIRYCLGQTIDDNGAFRMYGTGTGNATVDFYGNVAYPNESAGGFSMSGFNGTFTVNVYNNTFLGFVNISDPSGIGTLRFRNNLIIESDDPPLFDPGNDIDVHDHNIYYRIGGGTLVSAGGNAYDSSTLSVYEATALSSDPLLKNVSNPPSGFTGTYPNLTPTPDGLTLTTGSPALDAALDLGSPYNNSIGSVARPVGAGWDIGAYELTLYFPANPRVIHQVRMIK